MKGKDRHVMEALGMTRVVIEEGRVVEVGEPRLSYCPLFCKYRKIEEITPEAVRENLQFRIDDFGMCTPHRKMMMRDFLSFGISEMLAMCVDQDILDCGVIVCDGAGTVVISDPDLIQGIGGRISGLVETSPIPEIIEAIGLERVLEAESAIIDQVGGVRLAKELGYEAIGVTVTRSEDARAIREEFGNQVAIFAVHTSGVSREDAEALFLYCDLITACASQPIREIGESLALFSAGSRIPIYATSEFGERIMKRRLEAIGRSGQKDHSEATDTPRPLF